MFSRHGFPELCVAVCRPSLQRPKWGRVARGHPATLDIYQPILCQRLLCIVSCLPRFPPTPPIPPRGGVLPSSFPFLCCCRPKIPAPGVRCAAPIAPPTRYRTLFAVKPKDGFARCPLSLPSASPIHRRSIVPWDGTRVGGDPTPGGCERTAPSRFPRPAMGRGGPRVAGPRGSPRTRRPGPSALNSPPPPPLHSFRPPRFLPILSYSSHLPSPFPCPTLLYLRSRKFLRFRRRAVTGVYERTPCVGFAPTDRFPDGDF